MARRTRGSGEGSIYHRKDGRWAASLTVGYDETGRRRRKAIYGHTRQEVAQKLLRLQRDSMEGVLPNAGRLSVADFLKRWLEISARQSLRPATHHLYAAIIRNHVNPRIGGIRLAMLTPIHAEGMQADLERCGVSPRLRQIIHNLLRGALRQAVKWRLVNANPMDSVVRPRAAKPEIAPLDAAQVRRLLHAANGEHLEALYVLAVTTGLRQGELLGLQWGDVDWSGRTLHVRRQLSELQGRFDLSEPKTKKARRRIDLPSLAVDALETHRRKLGAVPHPKYLIFTDTHGGPIRKSNLIRREFKPLLRRAGLPDIRFHDLRHTAATLALLLGVHPKVVSERLGHVQTATTMDIYSHVLPSMQRDAADRLDALLAGNLTAK